VLLDDPAVVAAAVVLGGDGSKGAAGVRIDAYAVAGNGTIDPSAARLRAAKRRRWSTTVAEAGAASTLIRHHRGLGWR
jgi:hypothetical protein